MKKVLSVILLLVLCLSLCACGGGESSAPNDSKTTEVQSDSQSTDRRESMTKSEIETKVKSEAVWYAVNHIKNGAYSSKFDLDATTYKVGSIVEIGDYEYKVSGTLYLYDKYGSLKATAKFEHSCIWINKDGDAVGVGGIDVSIDF